MTSTDTLTTVPAKISAAVAAYYLIPTVWVGRIPTDEEYATIPVKELIRDEFRGCIAGKINVRVRRDGLFAFDFSKWPGAGATTIPGYQSGPGLTVPSEVSKAQEKMERKTSLRAQIMNAHLACLDTAAAVVRKRSLVLGVPILPTHVLEAMELDAEVFTGSRLSRQMNMYLAQELMFTRGVRLPEFKWRYHVEVDEVEYSMMLLESILQSPVDDFTLLTELLFKAACQYHEHRYAESVILCWTVCEKLIRHLWTQYLAENASGTDGVKRINNDREKKLKGRDFTVSIVSEILELSETLPFELFKEIDAIRQARNKWLHSLKEIDSDDASMAVRRTEKLVEHVTGIRFYLTLSRSIGHLTRPVA